MVGTALYVCTAVAFLLIALVLLIAFLQNSVDQHHLLATPTIPLKHGVVTSFASTKINASVDEVFAVLVNFEDYPKWSSSTEYRWHTHMTDGLLVPGCVGTLKVSGC